MAKTHEVRVKIGQVPYMSVVDGIEQQVWAYGPGMAQIDPNNLFPNGADPESEEFQSAVDDFRYGQLIEVNDADYKRLKAIAAVDDSDVVEEEIEAAADGELDVANASIEDLANWIKLEKPSVNDVVQASGGNAEYAKKLLEAESKAHDGDPRRSAVTGLTGVISRGDTSGS